MKATWTRLGWKNPLRTSAWFVRSCGTTWRRKSLIFRRATHPDDGVLATWFGKSLERRSYFTTSASAEGSWRACKPCSVYAAPSRLTCCSGCRQQNPCMRIHAHYTATRSISTRLHPISRGEASFVSNRNLSSTTTCIVQRCFPEFLSMVTSMRAAFWVLMPFFRQIAHLRIQVRV